MCLFSTTPDDKTTFSYGTSGRSASRIITGTAAFASVTLPKENELVAWHETEPRERLCFANPSVTSWPDCEDVVYQRGDAQISASRHSLLLSDIPQLRVYRAADIGKHPAVWLTYEPSGQARPFWFDPICEAARAFLSLLVGAHAPVLWRDTFVSEDRIRRLYFGGNPQHSPINGAEQPVPLGRSREALCHSKDVVARLPMMFKRFVEMRPTYNVEWIASPLWTARDGFVDDMLALACVSLERLSAAHDDFRKSAGQQGQAPLLTSEQGQALRTLLKSVLSDFCQKQGIERTIAETLEKKCNNLHQATNADKLSGVFSDLGIVLTDGEKQAIAMRNRCMHGRATLRESAETNAMDEELQRYDTLRTLINKAMLSVLHYEGPYVDYGARPEKGNFPIRMLGPNPTKGR